MTVVSLTINGESVTADVEPRTHLADFLREQRLLTGAHLGCEHGVCGACTLLIDGQTARACITLAVACDGAAVRTIEAFDADPVMARLRAAFTREHALQCGYCTPGMLATARDIALRLPDADEARIRLELSGNLCRCTGYAGIVRAILAVLDERRAAPDGLEPQQSPAFGNLPVRAAPAPSMGRSAAPLPAPRTAAGDGVSITIRAAPDQVWRILRDPAAVAACLPGASLDRVEPGGGLRGSVAIAFGPIRARFNGAASVDYDDTARRGVVTGGGKDAGGSAAQGSLTFQLSAAGPDTKLAAAIDYRLTGPLAQFGRGPLVEAFIQTLLEDFGRNLESTLAGSTMTRTELGSVRLLWRTLLRRLFGLTRR